MPRAGPSGSPWLMRVLLLIVGASLPSFLAAVDGGRWLGNPARWAAACIGWVMFWGMLYFLFARRRVAVWLRSGSGESLSWFDGVSVWLIACGAVVVLHACGPGGMKP